MKFWGDGYAGQEACSRWVNTSGRLVGWGLLAGDVSRVDGAVLGFKNVVDASENYIGWLVSATPFPLSLDHSLVVSVNLEVSAVAAG